MRPGNPVSRHGTIRYESGAKHRVITVLIADDHVAVAQGIAALLSDFKVVGTVHDGRALLSATQELHPDVVLTDISMPMLNGLDAIKQIKASWPRCKVIVLTMHADADLAAQAFRVGASGYVLKSSPGDEIITAIREVASGRVFLTSLIAKDLISVLLDAGKTGGVHGGELTPRQREVLQLIAEGRTMKEIASILNISPRTAESHKYDMMQALCVETTAELIQHAIRLKLVNVESK